MEKNIIDRCKSGDKVAQSIIYKKFRPVAINTCLRFAPTLEEGEEYAQECYLKLFDKIHTFEGNSYSKLGGWFKRMCTNYCIDKHRVKKNEDMVSIFEFDPIDESEAYSELEYSISDVVNASNKLSPRYKNVFISYYFDGDSHKEISNKLNIDVGTSKSNLYKAKKRLKEILISNKVDF